MINLFVRPPSEQDLDPSVHWETSISPSPIKIHTRLSEQKQMLPSSRLKQGSADWVRNTSDIPHLRKSSSKTLCPEPGAPQLHRTRGEKIYFIHNSEPVDPEFGGNTVIFYLALTRGACISISNNFPFGRLPSPAALRHPETTKQSSFPRSFTPDINTK